MSVFGRPKLLAAAIAGLLGWFCIDDIIEPSNTVAVIREPLINAPLLNFIESPFPSAYIVRHDDGTLTVREGYADLVSEGVVTPQPDGSAIASNPITGIKIGETNKDGEAFYCNSLALNPCAFNLVDDLYIGWNGWIRENNGFFHDTYLGDMEVEGDAVTPAEQAAAAMIFYRD